MLATPMDWCWGTPPSGGGAAPEVTFISRQTCHPLQIPQGYVPSGSEGAACPGWGKRLCPSLPPLLPLGASPPGLPAEGEWGDWVGQPAQPEQREGQWL